MGMYEVLTVGERDAERAGVCALAVMAKAPRPGKVKTRLAPPLTLEESAALNVCFLRDTTQNILETCERLTHVSESRCPPQRATALAGDPGCGAASAEGLVCY